MSNLRRMNIHVPMEVFDWISKRSDESGLTLVGVILSCIDQVRREDRVMDLMGQPGLAQLMEAARQAGVGVEGRKDNSGTTLDG